MSNWEYDSYFGKEWVKDFELVKSTGREAFVRFSPNGELWVGVEDNGSCCSNSASVNETYEDLSLEQAIELSTYINTVIIPNLLEAGANAVPN